MGETGRVAAPRRLVRLLLEVFVVVGLCLEQTVKVFLVDVVAFVVGGVRFGHRADGVPVVDWLESHFGCANERIAHVTDLFEINCSLGLDFGAANRTLVLLLEPLDDASLVEAVDARESQHLLAFFVITHADCALLFILVCCVRVLQRAKRSNRQLIEGLFADRIVLALHVLLFKLVKQLLGDFPVAP